MKQIVTEQMFIEAFKKMNRADQFSYKGLKCLYEYLEELESYTGEEIKLDVIAICCEYTEYKSLEDIQQDYSDIDIDNIYDLYDYTTVIRPDDLENIIIIQNF